jgi:hypothetical protein
MNECQEGKAGTEGVEARPAIMGEDRVKQNGTSSAADEKAMKMPLRRERVRVEERLDMVYMSRTMMPQGMPGGTAWQGRCRNRVCRAH